MTDSPPVLDPMPPQMVVPLGYETEVGHAWRRPVRLLLILSILYTAAAIVWKGLWFVSAFGMIIRGGLAVEHWLALAYVIAMVGAVGSTAAALVAAILCLRGRDFRRLLCILMLAGVACALAGSIAQSFYVVLRYNVPSGWLNLAMASLGALCQGMFPLAVTLLLWPRRDDPLQELFRRARM